ncbi:MULTISPECIES: hypothetical protein [Nitrospirillum]|uniref:Uncharacterized protein n=1 Tax=Nitrospirillum amazonense TaxID=28077 RepID=A0A560FKQ2_9PROT|nr:hypothetical protein [Nitrospirillum amazonense]MEC4590799.1 hypothetical protein [Nitrospirillum amazonense]TWB22185.1 hypothetical protein FBZ88_11615 [Nitrospirillum amazonense]
MSGDSLLRATLFGLVLQLVMVVAGHFSPAVAQFFAVGGMLISLLAGLVHGRTRLTWGPAAAGGAVAGGACALLGIFVSWILGDVPAMILALGTAMSALTGAIGGLIGWRLPRVLA